jgi:hypothetical protein
LDYWRTLFERANRQPGKAMQAKEPDELQSEEG